MLDSSRCVSRMWILLASALFLGGCTVTTNDGTTTAAGTGRLAAQWTIAGSTDPAQCTATGVASARVYVLNSAGAKVNSDDTQTCSAFGITFSEAFPAGAYTVQTTLLAADGTASTTTSSVPVTIASDGTTAQVATDFPSSSFVHPTTGTGKLEVYWTLDGSTDAGECTVRNVANARIAVLDSTGAKANTEDSQVCSALGTSFTQAFTAGVYTVQMTLIAADGTARTSTATATVTIPNDGSTAKVNVDFPATSFF